MYDTLYRKDNNGNINFWRVIVNPPSTGQQKNSITIEHGRLDGKVISDLVYCNKHPENEAKSRYNAKVKQGYKTVADIKDNNPLPVKGSLQSYLSLYLPNDRTTEDGSLLPMLAKTFDNDNNKLFNLNDNYIGQWKINGLRCFIRATETDGLFKDITFTFQSREGTYWNSLSNLSDYLKDSLPKALIDHMITDNWILDGELYIPGLSVNELNSAVKNVLNPYNKYIQFWCYDMYVEDTIQISRLNYINTYLFKYILNDINTRNDHYNVKSLFNVLPNVIIYQQEQATTYRDKFIDLGFEGLIMRKPNIEYAGGKRHMVKYKKSTDGLFTIVDIIPDGIKRSDVAKFVCRNDINDALFECHVGGTLDYQRECLINKDKYLGRNMYVEYGERSGVNKVPFHIKATYIK